MANCAVFQLEAEDYVSNRFIIHRESASGEATINYNEGQSLNLYFCLRFESRVALHDVKYSNDGGGDTFEVSIDGYKMGTVNTPDHSKFGENWDNFMSSNQLGDEMKLHSGRHKVTLNFTNTDKYGVEIDYIQIRVEDRRLSRHLFDCALYCVPDIHYDNGPVRDDMASAVAIRKVLPGTCPLEHNVLINVYHENIEHYLLSATLPKYRSFENNFGAEDGSCDKILDKNLLWKFQNIKLPLLNSDDNRFPDGASLSYRGSNISRSSSLLATFKAVQQEDDLDKGSVLHVRFKEPVNQLYLEVKYRGKDKAWSDPVGQFINSQNMEMSLTIPTDTWSTVEDNALELVVLADPDSFHKNVFETIELRRRRIQQQKEVNLFNKVDIQMNAVEEITGTPNEQAQKMTIRRRDTNELVNASSYLSIFSNTPWSNKNSEILRLYQDGRLFLIPMTPHGLSSVPLGSAVVIGQSEPAADQPMAPIDHVDIDPGALQVHITYKDGGKATLLLKSQMQATMVIVKDMKLVKDPISHPFATISTMWQYDGNSEVDHVSSNSNREHHVMNGWDTLHGTSFSFFRKCISRHKTQSPDLQLRVLTERDVLLYV